MNTKEKMTRTKDFTEKEQRVIDYLIQEQSYRGVAVKMNVKTSAIRAIMFRIRQRYEHARAFALKCEELQSKLPRKKRYITG